VEKLLPQGYWKEINKLAKMIKTGKRG